MRNRSPKPFANAASLTSRYRAANLKALRSYSRDVQELFGGSIASDMRELDGYRWRVMADPEGNEFCVVPREDA